MGKICRDFPRGWPPNRSGVLGVLLLGAGSCWSSAGNEPQDEAGGAAGVGQEAPQHVGVANATDTNEHDPSGGAGGTGATARGGASEAEDGDSIAEGGTLSPEASGGDASGGRAGATGEEGGDGNSSLAGAAGTGGAAVPVEAVGCSGARPARVRFVSPYIALANHPINVIVRGKALDTFGPTVTLKIGDHRVGPITIDSANQLTARAPALPVGRYPVTLEGSDCSQAELVVVAATPLEYAVIKAKSTRERLLWDAERQTLYAVSQTDQAIERYRYIAPDWVALSSLSVTDLTDIALTPNGRSLIVSSRDALFEVRLDEEPLVVAKRAANPDPFCGGYFHTLSMTNDGTAFVTFGLHGCSGYTPSYLFDVSSSSLTSNPYFDGYLADGIAAASGDGARVYAGHTSVSPPQPVKIYDSLSHHIADAAPAYNLHGLSVSGDASRVILAGVDVYARDLSLLGHLPLNAGALASRDSSRAFVLGEYGADANLVVHDLSADPDPDGIYPLIKKIDVPDAFAVALGTSLAFTDNEDDSTLFVAGYDHILVIPVK